MSDRESHLAAFERLRSSIDWTPNPACEGVGVVGRPARGLEHALDVVADVESPIVIEIGAEFGGSTRRWLTELPNSRVISIDPWFDEYKTKNWPELTAAVERGATIMSLFQHFCRDYQDRLAPVRGVCPEQLLHVADLGIVPDLVYIDGDHRYEAVLRDLFVADALFPETALTGDDWNFTSKARKYRRMDHPVRTAVHDFCSFRQYGLSSLRNTWVIDRSDEATIPPLRKLPVAEGGGPQRDLAKRVTALEQEIDTLKAASAD
ncbi:MAG: class I SAM-dependent methyltransferase, partial [Actinomycetota bacterium]